MFERPLSKQQRYSMQSVKTASSFSTALTESTSFRFSNVTDNESVSEDVNTSMKKLQLEGGSACASMNNIQEGFLNKSSTSEESVMSNSSTNM